MIKLKDNRKALEKLRDGLPFNLQTSKGFLMHVGGVLSKLEGDSQFIWLNGKWVKIDL